jgi:hypothetical protein
MVAKTVLLLNASNMDTFPVYPYSFIQVSAVARRSGIKVVCRDLLGIPKSRWGETIQGLIFQHNPSMILVTLRNTDTLTVTDYERDASQDDQNPPYFPIERTKGLITAIRQVTNLGIALGGFGFSILPGELMHYLQPDFGVFGGPDDFFAQFSDIEGGMLERVRNLLYFRDGELISNPRAYFPPFAGGEYTPEVIEEMMAFYASFPDPGFQGAPIEIIRGCNQTCVFCSEPLAKGHLVQYRRLASIMKDIQLLADHRITKLYMITSELNPEGNDFILQLADRIRAFNAERECERKITWFGANYLLGFSTDEYKRLYNSGFTGGWWDVTALDDENAREMRTPYRNRSLVKNLKLHAGAKREFIISPDESEGNGAVVSWTMFLGNPATTKETIRETLKIVHQEGIAKLFDSCGLSTHIRVFDYEEPDEDTLAVTYSVSEDLKRISYQHLLPSFAFPPALRQDFSEIEITELFKHLGETYLSTKYLRTRDWRGFIDQNTTARNITHWFEELESYRGNQTLDHQGIPADENIAGLDFLTTDVSSVDEFLLDEEKCEEMVNYLLFKSFEHFPEFFESLDLPGTSQDLVRITPYDLAGSVYSRWDTKDRFIEELNRFVQSYTQEWIQGLLQFCGLALLHKFNIIIQPEYKDIFIIHT